MEPADSIQRLGFRRWYERQLFESFAWLATCLLSGVVFAAVLELMGFPGGLTTLLTLTVLYFVGLMGITAWRVFWRSLSRAQGYAERANCPECEAYGLFDVTEPSERIGVRCRRCGEEWRINREAPLS